MQFKIWTGWWRVHDEVTVLYEGVLLTERGLSEADRTSIVENTGTVG